jgi:tetratricopeptide (TPR) repeat protein
MSFSKPEALRQAQQFMRQGNLSSAIAVYRKIVDAEPSDLVAISTLGDLYIKSGRMQDAVENFSRVAENYLRGGSDISARYILNKILKLDPQNPSAQVRMAELCQHEGDSEKAHEWLIEAGAAFWHKGDVNAAIDANRRALAINANSRHAKAALWALEQELQPAEPEPLPTLQPLVTGELEPIFISIGEDREGLYAAGAVEPVRTESPTAGEDDDAPPPPEGLPTLDQAVIIDQIANAELFAGYGQLDDAVATLRELLMQRPDHIEVRERLKDIYLRAEQTDRASEECINIAGIFAARGETGRARDYLIRAQRLAQSAEPTTRFSQMPNSNAGDADDAPQADLLNSLQNA